ncbi:MAG: MFS transporter [Propionicimonas sp.]|uniref:MFS transporter n=1 Tax=Propionicimonas sp. TaxID=1955623 RepID=UPI003D112357
MAAAATPNPGTSPSRRGLTVGLLLSVVAIAFEAMAVLTAMPAAAEDLGDVNLYAWTFTAFMLAQTFAIVAAGQFSDRFGPKPPLVVGFVVFALGIVVSASAPTMPVLLAGRFVQGLGGGTMNLAVMVLVARVFDPRERAVVLTGFSAAWMVPSFVGPAIAAWLSSTWSWHWVFWSVLPLMAVAGVLMLKPLRAVDLPPHDDVPAAPRQLAWAALVAAGAGALQLAGQDLQAWSLLWAALGLAMLWFGLPPLLPAGFRPAGRGLPSVIVVRALTAGGFAGAQTFLPLMFVRAEGLSLWWSGAILTFGSCGWMLGAWLQSRPWLRLRRDQIIVAGAVSLVVGLALPAVSAWFPGRLLALAVVGWVFAGLGMGLSVASTSLATMQLSAPIELGRNTSSLQVGESLGNSIGAGLAGTLFALGLARGDAVFGFGAPLTAMAVVGLLAALSSVRIGALENHSADR